MHDGTVTLGVQWMYGSPCGFSPTTCGQTAGQNWLFIFSGASCWSHTYTVHFNDDAGFPFSIAEAGVTQAGAQLQDAALKLAHLLDALAVLLSVLAHQTQIITPLNAVVVLCTHQQHINTSCSPVQS